MLYEVFREKQGDTIRGRIIDIAESDTDKAEVLSKFFASVFIPEDGDDLPVIEQALRSNFFTRANFSPRKSCYAGILPTWIFFAKSSFMIASIS